MNDAQIEAAGNGCVVVAAGCLTFVVQLAFWALAVYVCARIVKAVLL